MNESNRKFVKTLFAHLKPLKNLKKIAVCDLSASIDI